MNESASISIAMHWLFLWGDCLRERKNALDTGHPLGGLVAPYVKGAPDAGAFRPADDPAPMAFVVMQVEQTLGSFGPIDRSLALHLWSERRPIEEFNHPAGFKIVKTYRLRSAIVRRLAVSIERRAPETISDRAILEARRRLSAEWSAKQRRVQPSRVRDTPGE